MRHNTTERELRSIDGYVAAALEQRERQLAAWLATDAARALG